MASLADKARSTFIALEQRRWLDVKIGGDGEPSWNPHLEDYPKHCPTCGKENPIHATGMMRVKTCECK